MTFIKGCTGTFKSKKDAEFYDDIRDSLNQAMNSVDGFLLDNINPRITRNDIHFDLLKAITELTKANINLAQQVTLPMTLELAEYAIKIQSPHSKETKAQLKNLLPKRASDPWDVIFPKLMAKMNVALSVLEGRQSVNILLDYFNRFTDQNIARQLTNKEQITDPDLLDGFIECRKHHGIFLSQAAEAQNHFDELMKAHSPEQAQQFGDRWNAIKDLFTKNSEVFREKSKVDVLSDPRGRSRGDQNLLSGLGIFSALNKSVHARQSELESQLQSLFDNFQMESGAKNTLG